MFNPSKDHPGSHHSFFDINTRMVYPPTKNIAAPKNPLLNASAPTDSDRDTESLPEDDGIEIIDAPEHQKHVQSSDHTSVSDDKECQWQQKQATVEEDNKDEAAASSSSTASSTSNRNKLIPKSPQDCHRKGTSASIYVRPDCASQVVWETFNDEEPMPKGYIGTMGGIRWCRSTVEDYSPCGSGGGHYLICNHEVISKEPCGANCKTPQYSVPAFDCSQCRDIANEILTNKITDEEHAKMNCFRNNGSSLAIALCVEYIAKYLPERLGGITETVMCILNRDYGRKCLAYITNADDDEPKTLAEMFQKSHDRLEQKTREHLARQTIEPLVAHDKRKHGDDDDRSEVDAKRHTIVPGNTSKYEELSSSPCESIKKRRAKLETHRDPITNETRGLKRNTPDSEPDDSGYNADACNSGLKNNKRPKHKLRTHNEPINPSTHDTKRKHSSDGPAPYHHAKRTAATSSPKFGKVSFMAPPTIILASLLRKHENTLNTESNEQLQRGQDVLPANGENDPMSAFEKGEKSAGGDGMGI